MAKLFQKIEDRSAQRLINEVYEAAARFKGEFIIYVTHQTQRGQYLGMSQIGSPCDRSLWYTFRGEPRKPNDGRMLQLFNVGDYVEQMQIFWLEQAGYRITDRQGRHSEFNGLFRGHQDGIIHGVTRRQHIWDGKSCNKKKFEAIRQFGVQKIYPQYYCQAQMMMHYSGIDRAIYTFTCKDNSEWYAERFYYQPTAAIQLVTRARKIISANDPPPKPYAVDSFHCLWCDHRPICWYPEETIMENYVCGTCHYCLFPRGTTQPWCAHPDHPYEIKTWGISCPDWNDMFEKHPAKKERISIDRLGA